MATTTWALTAATRFVEQERAKAEAWAQVMNRRQIIIAQSPGFWESVCQAAQEQVEVFNEHVGNRILSTCSTPDGKLTLYAQLELGPRVVGIEFDPSTPAIVCKSMSGTGKLDHEHKYCIELGPANHLVLILSPDVTCSAEDFAGHILNGVLDWES
jgi:hypothetical protein